MKVKYVLHFDGQIIESNDERELRRITRGTECYWELWKHIIPSIKSTMGNQKLSIVDMKEMLNMEENGISPKEIAKEYGITYAWVVKVLKQMRMEKLKKLSYVKE